MIKAYPICHGKRGRQPKCIVPCLGGAGLSQRRGIRDLAGEKASPALTNWGPTRNGCTSGLAARKSKSLKFCNETWRHLSEIVKNYKKASEAGDVTIFRAPDAVRLLGRAGQERATREKEGGQK